MPRPHRPARAQITRARATIATLLPNATVCELRALVGMETVARAKCIVALGAVRGRSGADPPPRLRVVTSDLPDDTKARLIADLEAASDDDGNMGEYVDAVLRLPRAARPLPGDDLGATLDRARAALDASARGQDGLKRAVMQIVSERAAAPTARPVALGVRGPAGVGKTAIIRRGLAAALDLPFFTVALGGLGDAAHLLGFDRTYSNSTYGQLAKIAMEAGCTNPVIFFDELDKLSDSSAGRDIANVLIHLTDPEGCDAVRDRFAGPIDLSGATLVFAYNDPERVPPILRSRLREVEAVGYGDDEKKAIAIGHLVPEIRGEYGIPDNVVGIDEEVVAELVRRTGAERGVRQLRQHLAALMQSAAVAARTAGSVTLGVPAECIDAAAGRCTLAMPAARGALDAICSEHAPARVPMGMYT